MAATTAEATGPASALIETPVPNVNIDHGFGNPSNVNLPERCADKKVILVGLPGAFTPT